MGQAEIPTIPEEIGETSRLMQPLNTAAKRSAHLATRSFRERNRSELQKISNNPAAPMPPPTHMVTTPYLALRRLPSMSRWPVILAPDIP